MLLAQSPRTVPGYDGRLLLGLATDLADRLMPAFDTPSGLPLSWVNLRRVPSVSSLYLVLFLILQCMCYPYQPEE